MPFFATRPSRLSAPARGDRGHHRLRPVRALPRAPSV